LSKRICATTQLGVRGTRQGTCVVRVTVTTTSGATQSSRAYARVR
jgi:hypothetical protein